MARASVNVEESNNKIVIKEGKKSDVSITQKITDVVNITAIGPQGPKGAQGITGAQGPAGQLEVFQDLTVTGSLFVSGTIEQGNITGSNITASSGFIGNLTGTASNATSASYAVNATSASHADNTISAVSAVNATSASYALNATSAVNATSASYALNATSASFATTASFASSTTSASHAILADDATSSSFATTASFALNVPADTGFPFTGSAEILGSLNVIGSITSSGIISASGFSGSLEGTSSFSNNAEIAEYTSEWNLTADANNHYIFQGPGFTGSASDPNIYLVRGQKYKFNNTSGGHPFRIQSTVNGNLGTQYDNGVTNNNAGSGTTLLFNVPMNAPDVLYYQCTNHNSMGGPIYISHTSGSGGSGVGFPFTGSALITGSLNVIGPITASIVSSSGKISGSAFYGDGSNLSGIGSNPFPFTGSALVSGSFNVVGPLTASTMFMRERFTAAGLDSSGDVIIGTGGGNVVGLTLSSSVGTRLKTFGQNGSNFQFQYHDNAGASRGALIISQSEVSLVNRTTDGKVFIKASGEFGGSGDENTLAEFTHEAVTFNYPVTASIISASTLIGSIESASHAVFADDAESSSFATTASYALDATSASFATTASFALNVPADTGFPFTGSAGITGSLNVIGPISANGTISASTYFGNGSNLTGTSGRPFPYNSYLSPPATVTGSFFITGDIADNSRSGSLIVEGPISAEDFISASGVISASEFAGNITPLTTFISNSTSDVLFTLRNSNASDALTNTVGLHFKHHNSTAAKIIVGKKAPFGTFVGGLPAFETSFISLQTPYSGSLQERLRITATKDGASPHRASISTSGDITASKFSGDLIGTASFSTTSSFATTSSYVLNATSASFATTASFALNAGSGTGFPFTGSAAISGSLDVVGPITGSRPLTIYNSDEISSSPEAYSIELNPGRLSFFENPFLDTNQWTAFDFKSNGTKSFLYNSNGIVLETDKILGFGNPANDFIGPNNNILEIKATAKNIVLNPRKSGNLGGEIYHSGSFTHISSSGIITASQFIGDGKNLTNLPQSLAFDGTSGEGTLQYIPTFPQTQGATSTRLIATSSLIFNASSLDPVNQPIIFTDSPSDLTPTTIVGALNSKPSFIFSGSSGFSTDSTIDLLIEQGGVAVINLDLITEPSGSIDNEIFGNFNTGSTTDQKILNQIKEHLVASQSSTTGIGAFNPTTFNYRLLDALEIQPGGATNPSQIAIGSINISSPTTTENLQFSIFNSESVRRQKTFTDIPYVGTSSFFTESIFVDSVVDNRIYTSLETSLQTTFNSNVSSSGQISASVFYGDGSKLQNIGTNNVFPFTGSAIISGGLDVIGPITGSGVSASRFSGENPIFDGIISSSGVVVSNQFNFNPNSYPQFVNARLLTDGVNTSGQLTSVSENRDIIVANRSSTDNGEQYAGVGFIVSSSVGKVVYQKTGIGASTTGDFAFIVSDNSGKFEALRISGTKQEISSSYPITSSGLLLDYDNLPSSNPGIKGAVYRDSNNQLFISTGSI